MSIIKTSSFALSAVAAVFLAAGAANAMAPAKKPASATQQTRTQAARSAVPDWSAPKGPLDAKAYFDRMRHDGY